MADMVIAEVWKTLGVGSKPTFHTNKERRSLNIHQWSNGKTKDSKPFDIGSIPLWCANGTVVKLAIT